MPGRSIATVGVDIPAEVIEAAGLTPVRMAATADHAPLTPLLAGQPARTRSLVRQLVEGDFAGVAIAHGCVEDVQLFAVLRELDRLGQGCGIPVVFLDAQPGPGEARRTYNRRRLAQFRSWLEAIAGRAIGDEALRAAILDQNAVRARVRALRPDLSGVAALELVRSSGRLAPAAHRPGGRRAYVTGSPQETSLVYAAIEAQGFAIVGEDHEWGLAWAERDVAAQGDPWEALLDRWAAPAAFSPFADSLDRAAHAVTQAKALGAEVVLHLQAPRDEASPWDRGALSQAARAQGLDWIDLRLGRDDDPAAIARKAADALSGIPQAKPAPAAAARTASTSTPAPVGRRSRKTLESTADFGAWQRDWFAEVRSRAMSGPFAVVNADAPQEILRALDIPYVVNQWWASIVGAKQHGRAFAEALKAAGFPHDVESYSAQGLAAALVGEVEDAPWGGLPKPDFLSLVQGSDAGPKIFRAWASVTGAELFAFDRSVESRWNLPLEWWDDMPARWSTTLEPERLDLMTAQLQEAIARLEALTGRTFDTARFVEVMRLVNEQEDYYRRTRDLIAASRPAPIGIADSMPATMVPQWHRGTEWGRDAAKRFYEEVKARAEAGQGACENERVRLMWVGRGLWSDMGFYQRWEESHGAVFVWSMYLGLAADGYLRDFEGEHDALRSLAARFVTMGDELRMPTWAGAWHVNEARRHGVDGAVAIDDADPFVVEALQRAGIPVLRLALNNMDANGDALEREVTAFIEGPVARRMAQGA